MKIERPGGLFLHFGLPNEQVQIDVNKCFDYWFDQEVEPINKMFSEGVEVYGARAGATWFTSRGLHVRDTEKALLINIEPIKKETKEDVLRDLLNISKFSERGLIAYQDRVKDVLGLP